MNRRECACPYCDGGMPEGICTPCEVRPAPCPSCGAPQPADAKVCAACGAKMDETPNEEEA